MTRTAAFALLAALGFAAPALAAPYGGAPLATARTQVESPRGYRMSGPELVGSGDLARVHGAVCRTSRTAAAAPRAVRLDRLDAEGRVVGSSRALLIGNLSGRPGLGCAYYDVQPGLARSGETLRVSAGG
jgi:hypothetical protein